MTIAPQMPGPDDRLDIAVPLANQDTQPGLVQRHVSVWKQAGLLFWDNAGATAAGNLAFLTMLSLFPFLLFLLSLSGFIGQTDRGLEAVAFMLSVVPPEIEAVLEGPVKGVIKNAGAEVVGLSILFSLWVASAGIEAAREIVLSAYGREHAPAYWLRRLQSLILVIIAAVAILMAMTALVVTPVFLRALAAFLPDIAEGNLALFIKNVTLFLGPVILFFGLFSLYFSLTPRGLTKKRFFPGTILSLLVLLGTAKGFSVYLKYVDTYDITYGSLAGVMITQLFCYLVSIGFIFGAGINAAYAQQANGGQAVDDTERTDPIPQ